MKKKTFLFFSIIYTFVLISNINAAGIYENVNQSAEFVRTLTRYASTEIDSAFFNPAGSVFLKEGLYGYLSDQMLFDYQTMTDSSSVLSARSFPDKYQGEAMTWAFPDIYALYRQDNWSAFIHMGLIGRGAAATYEKSIPLVNKVVSSLVSMSLLSQPTYYRLEAYAYFIGMTLGGAYRINDNLSAGGGVRYVHAEQNIMLNYDFTDRSQNIDVNVDGDGNSCGFIGGFDLKPSGEMNIGVKYEYYTIMNITNQKPNSFDGPRFLIADPMFGLTKGSKTKMSLPMNASVGVSYMVTPLFKVEGGYIYYFNRLADWGKDFDGKEKAKKFDNGYDASIAFEYKFIEQFKASIGCSHSISGVNSKTRNNQLFGLDANTFGIGGTYTFEGGIDFTMATMVVLFKDTTEKNPSTIGGLLNDDGSTRYNDRVYSVAGSVSYKFL